MSLIKLNLPPSQKGYSFKDGPEIVSAILDGGLPRFRMDVIGSAFTSSVQWDLDKDGYNYLRAFYRNVTKRGSSPFLLDLVINDSELNEYKVYFKPNSLSLTGINGNTYTLTASLYIEQPLPDDEYDIAIVALYTELGAESLWFINTMSDVVNVDMVEP